MSEETIGSALRTQRMQLGLDQRDAATRIGMSRTTYSSYERDTQRPSVDVLPAIAGFLEVSIDDVLALFGASAIAAARTALGRLNLSGSVGGSATTVSEEIVPPHEVPVSRVFAPPNHIVDSHVSQNGGGYADEATDLSSGHPSVSIGTTDKPDIKVHDDGEKGKKKKKKKGKRGKLVTPAFATHV